MTHKSALSGKLPATCRDIICSLWARIISSFVEIPRDDIHKVRLLLLQQACREFLLLRTIDGSYSTLHGFICYVIIFSKNLFVWLKDVCSIRYLISSYKSSVTTSLPSGSTLFTPVSSVMNPASTQFLWRLQKGQEGFWYRLCFSTATAEAGDPQLCISVATARCQYCTRPEDSLQRVAKNWHATWTQVWSGNHFLANPDMLMTEQIVLVGPIYTVRKDEDLAHIASRYGIDLQDLLLWNPDVADLAAQQQQYVIHELQEICVVPQSCIYSGSISSSPTISHAAL